MLRQLDTLIGFAGVMSVISLLITIITQCVSSLLGLRGRNLADALEAMLHKLDPQLNAQVTGLGKTLADYILTHSAVSDSILSMSGRWPVSWKRASAIRPHELLAGLEQLSGQTPAPDGPPQTLEQAAAKLLKILSMPTPATTEAINALKARLPELAAQQGRAVIEHFNAATNVALGNLERRFNSAQDRARQWFAMHTRIITVIASVLVAFLFQLDSFQLLQRLSSDPEARARLVAGATALQQQAQQGLDEASPASQAIQSLVLIPNPYPAPGSGKWSWPWPHLLGILASVALLSLGAPFWFNLLKSLANLRPALAQQIENDPKSTPVRS